MMLKTIALGAVIAALGGAAVAQQGPATGLPPLNSGTPTSSLPPLQGAAVAPTGRATDTAARIGEAKLAPADSVEDSVGREIDKMGKTTDRAAALTPLDSSLGTSPTTLMRPGSGLVTSSGQAANWIPKP